MQYFKFTHLGPAPDGSERKLRFDLNAICDLEDAMDGSIYTILRERAGFNFMRHLLWTGCKWQEPALTPAVVGELIQKEILDKGLDLEVIVAPALEALRRSGVLKSGKEAQPKENEVVDLDQRPTESFVAVAVDAAEPTES